MKLQECSEVDNSENRIMEKVTRNPEIHNTENIMDPVAREYTGFDNFVNNPILSRQECPACDNAKNAIVDHQRNYSEVVNSENLILDEATGVCSEATISENPILDDVIGVCSEDNISENPILGEEAELYWHWGNCPMDLIFMFFSMLDTRTLAICFFVSKYWMDAVKCYCEHFNMWQEMVEDNIIHKGALYKEKCTLEWRELLMNFFLWRKVWKTTIFHHRNFNMKHIKTMKVYRENLVIVYEQEVTCFNLLNKECNKKLDVKCLNYEESDSLVVTLSREVANSNVYYALYVENKRIPIEPGIAKRQKFNLSFMGKYLLYSNCCYIMDVSNTLWVAKSDVRNFTVSAHAKFYGPNDCFIAMHVFDGIVYMVKKGGDLFYVQGLQFKMAYNILLPSHNYNSIPYLFNKGCAAYRVPADERFEVYELPVRGAVMLACPALSAFFEHGELIILGYDNGAIEIHAIYKLLISLYLPERKFNIKEFVHAEDDDYKIQAIDVYEELDKHYLIVAINSDVHQFLLELIL